MEDKNEITKSTKENDFTIISLSDLNDSLEEEAAPIFFRQIPLPKEGESESKIKKNDFFACPRCFF